jgi:alpha-L-fucosidase
MISFLNARAAWAVVGAALVMGASAVRAQQIFTVNPETGETQEQFAKRTEWWRIAKFGMFIHWGVYAVPADSSQGAAEWYFYNHTSPDPTTGQQQHLQVSEYEKFASQFNPVKFDAKKWVQIAKNAGMKYIVITSKHHDGFDMYDSKLSDYTVAKATPWKHDPMKDLARECKRQGLTFCFYHSIMDWHHPDYLPRRDWDTRPTAGADLNKYIDYMEGQLRELLTNYGRIGIIWFDGGWEHNAEQERSMEVVKLIRSLQPGIIINDRINLPEDYSTPEQTIPANALPGGRLWETCMTMNDTWGYAKNDNNWKPADDLIHKLCDIASKGGNFLLNVGPTGEGEIPDASVERLARVGAWMKVNSASIYGTSRSPFRRVSFDGRCTTRGNRLYLQVFKWPDQGLVLRGLQSKVVSATALDGKERLTVSTTPDGLSISRPTRIDPVATVVELKLDGAPKVEDQTAVSRPQADGTVSMRAADAEVHGNTAKYEQGNGDDNIGYWTDKADYVTWNFEAPDGGYGVDLTWACEPGTEGSEYSIEIDGNRVLTSTVEATSKWQDFHTKTLGNITLSAGKHTLAVKILNMPHFAAMNLQAITLKPVK